MNILNLLHSYTIEQVTGIDTCVSSEMLRKIELWNDIASGNAPWNGKAKPCGITKQICGKLSTMISREITLEVNNEAIKPPMEHIDRNIDKLIEYITLMGGAIIRPIYAGGRLQYEALQLGAYLPTKYDFDGTLTGAVLLKQFEDKDKRYLLTENHSFENNTHKVECKLFENKSGALRQVPLTASKQTESITPTYEWQNVKQPMIVEFRNNSINMVDGSNVPVSLISGAEDLIKYADEQFERMNWEQVVGEKKIFADRDMFQKRQKRNGETTETQLKPELNRLIMQIEGDGSQNGEKIKEWSPELRTAQQNEMFQQILRRIELAINIGKGSLSDMESVAQTATQYNGGRSEMFALVDRIEDEIETKYYKCAEIFAYMASAYGLGSNDSKIEVTWNEDSTRKDMTAAKTMALNEINAGVRNKWEYREDFFGEDEATAKANVPEEVQADFTPSIFGA